jgi:crossover junction endodeoxyribonuclease RusA
MLTLALPFPPSVNTYYRHVGSRVLISKPGRAYRVAVAAAVMKQTHTMKIRFPVERLRVFIHAHMPDKRTRDLDNLLKSLFDAMTHSGIWVDDSQIDGIYIMRVPSIKPCEGGVVVKIKVMVQP